MPTNLQSFDTATQIGTGATDIASTNTGEIKFIGQLTFTNTSASSVEVVLYKLLTSATETSGSGGNWLAKRTIQPGKVWNALADVGNLVMDPSETLSATAGTGSVVNSMCGGVVET